MFISPYNAKVVLYVVLFFLFKYHFDSRLVGRINVFNFSDVIFRQGFHFNDTS